MSSAKNRLYFLLSVLYVIGYAWIGIVVFKGIESVMVVCPIRAISGYPCPSCGSSHSIIKLLEGDFLGALYANPFGLIIFLSLLVGPIWLIYDYALRKDSFWLFYTKVESFLSKRKVIIFIIMLVLANWLWNLNKGL